MKVILITLIVIFAALIPQFSNASDKVTSITLGFNPGGNPDADKKLAIDLAADLQTELGLAVNVFMAKDYNGLIEAMKIGKIDFGFFSTLTFVEAEKVAGAKVLLKKVWQDPYYYSAIVAKQGTNIKSLKQLKGKSIAFVDQNSASGYLYPKVALQKAGLKESDFAKVIYSGNHAASVALLEKGEVDAIAIFVDDSRAISGAWTKFRSNIKMKIKLIWISEPIPNDPFCVREDFYQKNPMTTHSMMLALVDIFQKNKDKYSLLLGSKELMPATSRQFDPVREMVKHLEQEKK